MSTTLNDPQEQDGAQDASAPSNPTPPKNAFDMAALAAVLKTLDYATLLPYLLSAGLLTVLAWPVLHWWHYAYTVPESYYAHAPVIPLIVGLMLWYRRDALKAVPKQPCLPALIVLLPSLFLLIFSIKLRAEALESTGFLLTIWSSVWFALGTKFLRVAAFPLGFLLLMAPLPGPILNDATQRIQMTSTDLADKMLNLLTFHTHRDVGNSNIIKMENFSLFVDVPCSGFKLLLSLLTFSAAFAYLVDGSIKKRFMLFLFSLPLSLVINGARIALIGIVGECIGSSAAHTFHDWSGMITLVLGFVVLFTLAKVLGCRKFAGWDIF